jgi:hypothetical protein
MIEHKCNKCRNVFPDCSSDPVFVSEDIAATENIPEDTILDCDCFVPEGEDDMSAETEAHDNPCETCYQEREHCGHNPDQNGHCDYYNKDGFELEKDEDEDEDIEEMPEDDDDDFSDPLDDDEDISDPLDDEDISDPLDDGGYDTGLH